MESIILEGKLQSTNNLYKVTVRGGRPHMYMTADAKAMKQSYQWQAKTQWKKGVLTGDIVLDIKLYFQDKRRRDWDNYHKITMDALEGVVYEDDRQIQDARVRKYLDRDKPRIEIIVK